MLIGGLSAARLADDRRKIQRYEIEWIIKLAEINEASDQLYVSARGLYAVERLFAGQILYVPASVLSPHSAFGRIEFFNRCCGGRLHYLRGEDVWHLPGGAFEKVLKGEKLSLTEHLALDDTDVSTI